jgi:hypothetical protein
MTVNGAGTVTATFTATSVTVTRSPSAYGEYDWNNDDRAYSDDSNYAYSTSNNDQERYSGYGFNIPTGATITKVRVRLDAWCEDNDDIRLEVSANGGSYLATTSTLTGLTTSQATYWIDVTGWTSWTRTMLNNDNIWVRVTHIRPGSYGTDDVYLDWIPIEVTYTP